VPLARRQGTCPPLARQEGQCALRPIEPCKQLLQCSSAHSLEAAAFRQERLNAFLRCQTGAFRAGRDRGPSKGRADRHDRGGVSGVHRHARVDATRLGRGALKVSLRDLVPGDFHPRRPSRASRGLRWTASLQHVVGSSRVRLRWACCSPQESLSGHSRVRTSSTPPLTRPIPRRMRSSSY